jgi:hypothetical protein
MVVAINGYRADRDLDPLSVDGTLMQLARLRVSVFDHYHPRYGWMHEHARQHGYIATDNIARGYETPEDAVGDATSGWGDERDGHTVGHDMQMKGFIKRDGQWVNMDFDKVGVAVQRPNYIAVFGRKAG